jgi:hypothetical protein
MWFRLNLHRIQIDNEMMCIQQLNFCYHESKVKLKSLSTFIPVKELRYQLYKKVGGPQSHSGGLGKGNYHFPSRDSKSEPSSL